MTLDNEDGNVVYKVIIGQHEVLVDAGNGQVLETERVGTESNPEQPLHSTLQAPEAHEPEGQEIE